MTGTDPKVPSLAELRAKLSAVEPVFSAADRARRGTELEILAHVPALLDIAEAADAVMTAYVDGDTFEGECAHPAMERLENLLAKVRP